MLSLPFRRQKPTDKSRITSYNRYLSDAALAQYCDSHYGPDKFGITNFSTQLVQRCLNHVQEHRRQNALDLGCAVGRTSFELGRHFTKVSAIDFSPHFIHITPRRHLLGGFCCAGKPLRSLEGLRKLLSRHFAPVGEPQEVELIFRENARKYQHYVSQVTFWQRMR
jgi:hypothetical protein